MKLGITGILALTLTFLAGCAGFIDEGEPALVHKLPRSKRVCVVTPVNYSGRQLHARGADEVRAAFLKALEKRHVRSVVKDSPHDIEISVAITAWEYNSEGFTGKGERDSITLDVRVTDTHTKRVKARATLRARKLDELVDEYVDDLFIDPIENE